MANDSEDAYTGPLPFLLSRMLFILVGILISLSAVPMLLYRHFHPDHMDLDAPAELRFGSHTGQ